MGLVRVQYTGLSDQRILSAKDQGLEEGDDLVFAPAKTHEIPEELFQQLRGGEPGSWSVVRETDEEAEAKESAAAKGSPEKVEKAKASKPEE